MLDRKDPLRDIPGPVLARWTPLWLFYHSRRGRRFEAVHRAHQRYGRLVRISRNHVSVNDAEAIPFVYGHGNAALLKSKYYDSFVAGAPSVFSTTDRADHTRKRRLASHAFSVKSLHSLSPFVQNVVEEFVYQLDNFAGSGSPIDMMKWFNYLAWDIISDLAFGEAVGFVKRGTDHIEVKAPDGTIYKEEAIHVVDNREHLASVLGTVPALRHWAKYIPDPFFIRGRKSALGITLIARERVDKRIRTNAKRDDLLNKLIEARMKESGELSDKQVTELTAEAVTILIAGSHTAAASTAAILHLLRKNERVYEKLMQELTESFGEGQIPTHEQLKKLPYLQAVITEGLRHHGTNAIGLPRLVPEGGIILLGRPYPEGAELSVPSWSIGHDEEYWGDPYTFRPERWLENPELKKYDLTFGAGPRTCVSSFLSIVNMEMLLVLSAFLLRYDVELQSPILETVERFQHEPAHMRVKINRKADA
ncbi:benzoate para-hydroxylase [Mycena capillaripes]|nr:benzoate para-hydroxylase [Mycena capillaripes]